MNTQPKSTIFTSRRILLFFAGCIFTGVAMQFPAVQPYIPELMQLTGVLIATGFAAFTITDIDWGQKANEATQGAVSPELLEEIRAEFQAVLEQEITKQVVRVISELKANLPK